jgi:acyl-CoA hydrolase
MQNIKAVEERKVKLSSDSKTIMTEMIMPNDTNPIGNLMGGNLMRWMDIVGAICAAKHCEAQVVTASVDNVSFQEAIKMGEVITLNAQVTRAFNTSAEVFVEVFSNHIDGSGARKCNHAYLTFVAIDMKSMQPKLVPDLKPSTMEEENHFAGAARRREIRLIQSGRLKPADAKEVKNYFEISK